jgi:CelD/BcsL family acetyltransferase involved in cellulose biosynthesis
MTATLEIDTIGDDAALRALEPEWWELWWQCPDATPFQSPAWLLPWRRHFRAGDLVVLTLRRAGRLTGFLPLFHYGGAPEPRLLPLGAGNTDYLDGLFTPDAGRREVAALINRLAPWHAVDLPQLPPSSSLLDVPVPAGWIDQRFPEIPCPILPLPASLPRRMAQNLRYYRRRAERAGTLRFETAVPDRVLLLLENLVRLHGARWTAKGESGVLADATTGWFHRYATLALAAAGLLRLHALHLDDRIVAVLYGMQAKGRAYYYLSGYDPEFSHLGLGTLIVGHAIDAATLEGAREFDFLRGAEPYKYHWGAHDRAAECRLLRYAP